MGEDRPIRPRGRDLSHPSMDDPWARLLFRRMADISQDTFAAGWYLGIEHLLWQALEDPERALLTLSAREVEELRALSTQARGWIWTGGEEEYLPRLLDFEAWARVDQAAREADEPRA